jgi:hypothetical protein
LLIGQAHNGMRGGKQMYIKEIFNYLNYKSFDESVHYIKRISAERVIDSENSERRIIENVLRSHFRVFRSFNLGKLQE